MRPALLNPLFAEVTSLKGVGSALAKPLERLGLERVKDVLFHLPTGHLDRWPRDELMQEDVGRTIAITVRAVDQPEDAMAGADIAMPVTTEDGPNIPTVAATAPQKPDTRQPSSVATIMFGPGAAWASANSALREPLAGQKWRTPALNSISPAATDARSGPARNTRGPPRLLMVLTKNTSFGSSNGSSGR